MRPLIVSSGPEVPRDPMGRVSVASPFTLDAADRRVQVIEPCGLHRTLGAARHASVGRHGYSTHVGIYVIGISDSGRRPLHNVNALQAVHRLSNASDHDLLTLAARRVQVAAESAPDSFHLWVIVHLVLANLICRGWDPFCGEL